MVGFSSSPLIIAVMTYHTAFSVTYLNVVKKMVKLNNQYICMEKTHVKGKVCG